MDWPLPPRARNAGMGLAAHGGREAAARGCQVRGSCKVRIMSFTVPVLVLAMLPLAPGVARRRLHGKQRPPPAHEPNAEVAAAPLAAAAIAAEGLAADGLIALPADARRRHVHYTHVRTFGPADVQPEQLTRQEFWEHLVRCYREAFPSAETGTGSILAFGLVVKELHKDAPLAADRSEHHHAATFSITQHRWKQVRKISAGRYHIHLNAVAHEAYSTMFQYLRAPTSRKPLHELDPQPFFSDGHPEGDALKELLAAGERYKQVRAHRQQLRAGEAGDASMEARSQFGLAFNHVIHNGLRKRKGALQFQVDAVSAFRAGKPKLLEFAKRHSHDLEEQLDLCWALEGAPAALRRVDTPRERLLLAALTDGECVNGGSMCGQTYNAIVTYQSIDATTFRHKLYEALVHGRKKGYPLMIVGGNDTGKTTITQPAAVIFKTMPTPQADSFCPLESCRGHELFLWHDFRYNPGHPGRDEQGLRIDEGTWNRLLEGLPTRIGVPKTGDRTDFLYDEDAAFIFTGPFEMTAYKNGKPDAKETAQLACRVQHVHFSTQSRGVYRGQGLQPCPKCWSRWLLEGAVDWEKAAQGRVVDPFLQEAERALVMEAETQTAAGRDFHPGFVSGRGSAEPHDQRPCRGLAAQTQAASSWEPHSRNGAPLAAAGPVATFPAPLTAAARPVAAVPAAAFFEQLQSLMDWRGRGWLTEAEFLEAKTRIFCS